MLTIDRLTVEHLGHGCVTDNPNPRFSYTLNGAADDVVRDVTLTVGEWTVHPDTSIATPYDGPALTPFTTYPVTLAVTDAQGVTVTATTSFETGRLGEPWVGTWITDGDYQFTEKKVSPKPMSFRRTVTLAAGKTVARARLFATAMGVYEFALDGRKVGDRYFAPGFTSYKTNLQYQTYDVTDQLTNDGANSDANDDATGTHTLIATVAGGWAVGSFVFTRVNRVTADRQALLAELRIDYTDGTSETIGTDADWDVTMDGPFTMADLYDGETYDATRAFGPDGNAGGAHWRKASIERPKTTPKHIEADYGAPVREHETFAPISCKRRADGEIIYDFGQNFAGVVRLDIANAAAGQTITVRHAEILNPDGTLNTTFLRTAKATATYTCVAGNQSYAPRFTYMGFRYIAVRGIEPKQLTVTGVALYSELTRTGDFACSDERLNQLQSNIVWGAKSNLFDIPTDCPQRDERMGWTGDIAVFAPTACYDFDMGRFLDKWLRDVKAEQLPTGGLPNTVPVQGYGFPATMPEMAIAWWGDAVVLVPWAEYQARGDASVLERMYEPMKRYVNACRFWAGLFGFGKHRYIWWMPTPFQFGDWIAPDVPKMQQWQARGKWTGTASLNNTARTLARVARVLGHDDDAREYDALADRVADAYVSVFTDGDGRLNDEFQTAYVLPLHLGMFPDAATRTKAVNNLAALVERNDYRIGTGFPGTPYILFALADNGRPDVAFRMLTNERCPSWLYEVKMGATTIWERWDGLDEHGECPIGDDGTDLMISYNHYASGAVGAFLYQRIAGIEPIEAGYRRFRVRPLVGGGLTWANGHVDTPYGRVGSAWSITGDRFDVTVDVPFGTTCALTMPDGTTHELTAGTHTATCTL
ncbi:Alpha-L-rhamnosidase protein [Bifidobacterium ramosum]|uniref:alpha-L-rhamnosidase n=1 Tax=Bifidobacterium ramosum TaxID=1798158 RepID=A0A6L4WXB5_9BIFI|nr:family 78 glycoside hydrolase catalytic domain [Bifidobacterium ramosum]KAB8286630.1 Alpha-L-rhamnosidase protein [Bifidobacterium ramosum]NEG72811.1 Bacterial alpha-L-rhamnosidase [Bifidobacterium ramosum]